MNFLSYNPGHDGAIAFLQDSRLMFSVESEKDSNYRYSAVSVSDVIGAVGELGVIPDVICMGGWWLVTLSAASGGITEAELKLYEYNAFIRVVDDTQQAVVGANIEEPDGGWLPEVEPGLFSVLEARPGAPLIVTASGYSAACQLAPENGRVLVVMLKHGALRRRIEYLGGANISHPIRRPIGVLRADDLGCSIPLMSLDHARLADHSKDSTTFMFFDFPIVRRAEIASEPTGYHFGTPVGADGDTVRIRLEH